MLQMRRSGWHLLSRTMNSQLTRRRVKLVCRSQEHKDGHATVPMSLGVPLISYDISTALAAVSTKAFACTMCGRCCTLQDDAEVNVH